MAGARKTHHNTLSGPARFVLALVTGTLMLSSAAACSSLNQPRKEAPTLRRDAGSALGACDSCPARCYADSEGIARCADCRPGAFDSCGCAGGDCFCLFTDSTPAPVCVDTCDGLRPCVVGRCVRVMNDFGIGGTACVP